jgi:signal transduction histidine kinase
MLNASHPGKPKKDAITLSMHISLALMCILALLLFWATWSHNIFDAYGFAPHGYCFLWNTRLVTLHVVSDMLIGLAYVTISVTLLHFVRTIYRDLPFRWIFVAFGSFIIACGATHFLDVWTLWYATYWLSGTVKLITAIASLSTAIILPPLLPKVRLLIASAKASEERKQQLESAHHDLEGLYQKAQELDQLKTQFFANVSHELRTPLTLILGSVHALTAENSNADLEVIQRNALTLLKYINDLLDIAKGEAGKVNISYSQVDLAHLLQDSLDHFTRLAQTRQITVHLEMPASLVAEGDPDKLQRIFLNILSNAFKFTPTGGLIRCVLTQDNEYATTRIEDSGPGIPPELRQTIFEPFKQAEIGTLNASGTGLGLAIVKEFIVLHHGTIAISDRPEGGACFTFQLPLHAPSGISIATNTPVVATLAEEIYQTHIEPLADLEYEPGQPETQEILPGRPCILIIEDNIAMSRYIVRLLSTHYQTATAHDGLEGLAKAHALRPDLILCDFMMPKMDGEHFIKEMRTRPELRAIPLIMLSAHTNHMLRIQLLREGAQDYLVKPFFPEELQARIANLLAMKQARGMLQRELTSQSQDIISLTNEAIVQKHELENTNQQLREMARLQQDFVSVVSHEFRTTLTSIQGFSELLYTEDFSTEEVKEYASDIHTDAIRLNRMITNLLDLERMKAGKMALNLERIDLNALLTKLADKIRATTPPDYPIHLHLDPALPPIDADRDKLTQAILNLLSNAVKYSPAGGTILVSSYLEEGNAHLSVQDHGSGLTPENIAGLFVPYNRVRSEETRHIQGTGLGLAIIKEICNIHHGRVWVESTLGQGSTFHITLPLKIPLEVA